MLKNVKWYLWKYGLKIINYINVFFYYENKIDYTI